MNNKYLKYIYGIIIFYVIWLVCIPLGFRFIADTFSNKINEICIIKPRLYTSIFPNIKLKAEEIKILNKDSTLALKITEPKVNVRILPLILARVHINSLESKNITAKLYLKDKLYLGDYPIELPKSNNNIKLDRLKISDVTLNLCQNTDKHIFNGKNIYYKTKGKSLIFHMTSDLISDNVTSGAYFDVNLPNNKNYKKYKFNVDICELNINPLSRLIQYYTKDISGYETENMEGIINLHSDNKKMYAGLNGLKIFFKDKNKSMIFPEKFYLNSSHIIEKNTIKIYNANAEGSNLHASLSGKIKNYLSQKPHFDLDITIQKSDMREGAMLLPPVITSDINIPKLKEYPFYGDIIGSLKVKGCIPEPDIYGKIKVTNGVLIRPIPNSTGGAKINIEFIGKKLLLDVKVPAGGKEIVTVDGDIDIYGEKFSHLNIKSSDTVNLSVAEFALNPIHEVFCFMLGPVPIMDIDGFGNVDIKVVGTKKNPHIWGDFNFRNTKASFNEVNHLVLENADGNLHFDNQKAHFINRTGTLHGQKATVEGTCSLFGDLDFDVHANNQELNNLYLTLSDSPMLKDLSDIIPKLENIKGKSDLYLNLKGKLYDINDLKINENVIPSGYIKLLGNSFSLDNLNILGIHGNINFNKKDCDFKLKSTLSKNSIIDIEGLVKNDIADVKINSPRLLVNEFDKENMKIFDDIFVKITAKYKGKINEIEYGGIDAIVDILPDNKYAKNAKISSGNITLKNAEISIKNLRGMVKQNPFYINLSAKNIGNKNFNILNAHLNGDFNCKDFDLTALNFIIKSKIFPKNIQKELDKIVFKSGRTTVNAQARNSRLDGKIYIGNTEVNYALNNKIHIPIKLLGGQFLLKNNSIKLNKLSGLIDEMPIIIYGQIDNILKTPQYKINFNSKLVQRTFDRYWNSTNIYPIKTGGDILVYAQCQGNPSRTNIKSAIKIETGSSIYYMGTTLGDINNPNSISLDADMDKSGYVRLNRFDYNKYISSQNKLPIITIKGGFKPIGKIYELNNITVKTNNPANADLFNIIFKKPTIKSGTFTSDIRINGTSKYPKVLGKFNAKNIKMPYLNTSIKDIDMTFDNNVIQVLTKGNIFDNYIMINSKIRNNFIPPYKINNADIYINDLDLNNSINQLKQLELKGISSAIGVPATGSGTNIIHSILFDNVKIRAGNIQIKNIKATNLEADCSLNNKMQISVNSFKFNMASGELYGKLSYNLLNNFMQMEMDAKDVNANSLTYALFDIQNQIFGALSGHIDLTCNATDEKTRLMTLNGTGTFNVTEGRMPKLGSLEYLLKAGNLIKGGITGLSMNSVLDVIAPMKTGEFNRISGRIRIKDGVAKTIEINSYGKNLNLYIIGSLNLYTSIADMHVFGQLSRKASTIFGAIGNISLNTIFNKIPGISLEGNSQLLNDLNKIPGIELTSKATRKFMVEILGDINGNDFVKSFKWIN